MAGRMGKAVIDVEGNFEPLQREAAGQSDQIGTSMGSGLGKKLGVAAGIAAAAGIGIAAAEVGKSITAASDLNEAINATGLVFGDAAAGMDKFFDSSATNLGIAETAARQSATAIGALFGNLGFSAGEASTATQDLMTRAADLGSAFNAEPQEVVEALGAALRGETEPARRFGISLDDASIKAKAVAMGLADSTANVSKNAKAQASLALIMEQSNKVAGDFANTSDGLANSQRILSAQLQDLRAGLGTALLPAITAITGALKDLMPALQPVIQALGARLGALFEKLVPVISRLLPVIGELVDALGTNLLVIVEALAPPLLELLDALAPLIPVISRLVTTILTAVAGALEPLLAAIGPVVDILVTALAPVLETIGPQFGTLGLALGEVLTALAPLLPSLAELVAALLPLLPPLIQLQTATLPLIIPLVTLLAKVLGAGLTPVVEGLTAALVPIVAVFANVAEAIAEVPTKAGVIIDWFRALPGVLLGAVSALPALLTQLGYNTVTGFLQGLRGAWSAVAGWLAGVGSAIVSGVGNLGSVLLGAGSDAIGSLARGIREGWSGVTNFLGNTGDRIVDAVGNMGSVLYSAGVDLMKGFLNGIKSMASSLASTAKDVALAPVNAVKGVLGIGSPSKVMLAVGLDTMEGLRLGLERGGKATAEMLSGWGPALEAGLGSTLAPVVGAVTTGAAAPIDARLILNAPVYGLDELDHWADQRDRQLMAALSVRGY